MDDLFSSVSSAGRRSDAALEGIFSRLFETDREDFSDEVLVPEGSEDGTESGIEFELPELEDGWLEEPEIWDKKERLVSRNTKLSDLRQKRAEQFEQLNKDFHPPYPVPQDRPPDFESASDDESSLDEPSDDEASLLSALEGDDLDKNDSQGAVPAAAPPPDHAAPRQLRCSRRLMRDAVPQAVPPS